MAKCPGCGGQVAWDAQACPNCSATFGPPPAWHPKPESAEEEASICALYPPAPPVPLGRLGVANVALGFVLGLSALSLSPVVWILSWFLDEVLLRSVGGWNAMLLIVFAHYWLPTLVVYLILRAVRAETWLKPAMGALIFIAVANLLFLLYTAAGGWAVGIAAGAGSPLRYAYAPLVVTPAKWLLAVGFAWLVAASIAGRGTKIGRQHFTRGEFAVMAMVVALPAFFGWTLTFAPGGAFRAAREAKALFERRCGSAGEKLLKAPAEPVRSLYLESDGGVNYDLIKGGAYGNRSHGILGERLANSGYILFFEKRNPYKSKDGMPPAPYLRQYAKEWKGRPVHELESRYGVLTKRLMLPEEEKLGLYGEEVRIVDLGTQETLAVSTYFADHKRSRFCGHAPDGSFSTTGVIRRALGLKRESQKIVQE